MALFDKPDGYVPKDATFDSQRPRLPVGTMSFAKDGTTIAGLFDSGAQVSCLSARVAKALGLMPFDGVRTAVAAGGGTLNCYGMANSVECYMDGAFLKVDWLITGNSSADQMEEHPPAQSTTSS